MTISKMYGTAVNSFLITPGDREPDEERFFVEVEQFLRQGATHITLGLHSNHTPAGLEKFRHSSYPIENHTTIRTETFGLKVSGKGDAKICLKNSVGQKLKIYVTDTKITVDRTMAGYKEFSEHFMTEKYSISTAARKKDGAWNLELVFDVSILELFAEDGVDAISTVVYPETPYDRVSWKGDLSVELYEIDA